jgi:hypothetical protein
MYITNDSLGLVWQASEHWYKTHITLLLRICTLFIIHCVKQMQQHILEE